MSGAPPPIVVLVRPQLGQNIGKAARAMLNFGLTEMRLVAPRDGWPNPEAGPAASGADQVLQNARVFETTAESIADCSHVFASTVRRRDLVMPVVGPQEMANAIHGSTGRSAILFGPDGVEERGGVADATAGFPLAAGGHVADQPAELTVTTRGVPVGADRRPALPRRGLGPHHRRHQPGPQPGPVLARVGE